MSLGDALHERVYDPLGIKAPPFSVDGVNIRRPAATYRPVDR